MELALELELELELELKLELELRLELTLELGLSLGLGRARKGIMVRVDKPVQEGCLTLPPFLVSYDPG
jgi:hypothetical protein